MIRLYLLRTPERELVYPVEISPMISRELEGESLFSFPAGLLEATIYDRDGDLKPGGTAELTRGEEIRAEAEGVEIFRGLLDREFNYTPREGLIRFRALGFGTALNSIYLGRARTEWWGASYRMRRDRWFLTRMEARLPGEEEQQQYEWVFHPFWYDYYLSRQPGLVIGAKNANRFDTLPARDGRPFQMEGLQRHYLPVYDRDGTLLQGIVRMRADQSLIRSVEIEEIAAEALAQARDWGGDWTMTFAPGDIQLEGTLIPALGKVYGALDVFRKMVDGQEIVFAVGWNSSDGEYLVDGSPTQRVEGPAEIFRIVNTTGHQMIREYDFADYVRTEQLLRGGTVQVEFSQDGLLAARKIIKEDVEGRPWTLEIADDRVRHIIGRGYDAAGERVGIYQLWSWLERESITYYRRFWAYSYAIINLNTGHTIKRGADWDLRKGVLMKSPEYYESVDLNADRYDEPAFAPRPLTDGSGNKRATRLEIDGTVYFDVIGMLYASGNLSQRSLSIMAEEMTAGELLVEIAKATNSVLSVTNRREIRVTPRTYYDGVTEIAASLIEYFEQRRSDYWGDQTPQFDSRIITNESHLAALRKYYRETYFAQREDVFSLSLRLTAETAAIDIQRGLRFEGMDANWTAANPAVVRRVDIDNGGVYVEAARQLPERSVRSLA